MKVMSPERRRLINQKWIEGQEAVIDTVTGYEERNLIQACMILNMRRKMALEYGYYSQK